MDVDISVIELTIENNPVIVIEWRRDLSKYNLTQIRQNLTQRYYPTSPQNAGNYEYIVNGVVVGYMDAPNKMGSRRMQIALKLINQAGSIIDPQREKRQRDETTRIEQRIDEETQKNFKPIEGIPYEVSKHIFRVMQSQRFVFEQDKVSNGVTHHQILDLFGFLGANIQKIQLPEDLRRYNLRIELINSKTIDFIVSNFMQNREYANNTLVVCPFFVRNHVSLCCYNTRNNNLLHFDASSSFSPANEDIFTNISKFNNVCLTYVNYQMYDDTFANLAGGNCSMFTGINVIKYLHTFQSQRITFQMFWDRFLEVIKLTQVEKRRQILYCTAKNVLFAAESGWNGTNGMRDWFDFAMPIPLEQMTILPNFLNWRHGKWSDTTDFTCDYIILGYFLDAKVGFDQVNLLGNVLRILLKDIRERKPEFENLTKNIKFIMSTMCIGCQSSTATFVCPCHPSIRYCGHDCQVEHWAEHKKNH